MWPTARSRLAARHRVAQTTALAAGDGNVTRVKRSQTTISSDSQTTLSSQTSQTSQPNFFANTNHFGSFAFSPIRICPKGLNKNAKNTCLLSLLYSLSSERAGRGVPHARVVDAHMLTAVLRVVGRHHQAVVLGRVPVGALLPAPLHVRRPRIHRRRSWWRRPDAGPL